MKTLGNIIWTLVAGIWICIAHLAVGIAQCVTLIGIPFGIQSFKLAGLALWPFGRKVVKRQGGDVALRLLGNVLWFIFGGFISAIFNMLIGLVLCATFVGIPFGIQCFKLAKLTLAPFGKLIVKADDPAPAVYSPAANL